MDSVSCVGAHNVGETIKSGGCKKKDVDHPPGVANAKKRSCERGRQEAGKRTERRVLSNDTTAERTEPIDVWEGENKKE